MGELHSFGLWYLVGPEQTVSQHKLEMDLGIQRGFLNQLIGEQIEAKSSKSCQNRTNLLPIPLEYKVEPAPELAEKKDRIFPTAEVFASVLYLLSFFHLRLWQAPLVESQLFNCLHL